MPTNAPFDPHSEPDPEALPEPQTLSELKERAQIQQGAIFLLHAGEPLPEPDPNAPDPLAGLPTLWD